MKRAFLIGLCLMISASAFAQSGTIKIDPTATNTTPYYVVVEAPVLSAAPPILTLPKYSFSYNLNGSMILRVTQNGRVTCYRVTKIEWEKMADKGLYIALCANRKKLPREKR